MTHAAPLVTKKSLGLTGLAAFGACAACCALPMLAAAGIGGSVLSGVAGLIRPGADLIMAGVVGVGVLGVMAWRAGGARSAACDTVCATDGGCGCSSAGGGGSIYSTPSPRAEEPIVCTADLRNKPTMQGQLDGYRAAFEHLLRIERFEGGARWVFQKRPALDVELRSLAEKEHQCCSFFQFDVRADGDVLVWETTAHESAAEVLDEFVRLPKRLNQHARGNETASIKQAIGNAGLIFAADTSPAK
jgi:hypothetical protein